MTTYKLIIELLRKKVLGEISQDEMLILQNWANENEARRKLLDEISFDKFIWEDIQSWKSLEEDDSQVWDERLNDLVFQKIEADKRQPYSFKKYYYIAASLLVFISLVLGLFHLKTTNNPLLDGTNNTLTDFDVLPGKDMAYIRMDDGRVLPLEMTKKGLIIDNGLKYNDGSKVDLGGNKLSKYIELVVPRGAEYFVSLSDGTKVWLNADSYLKYPLQFSATERVVELNGEAYFDVKSQVKHNRKIPFRVRTEFQDIEVLGTQFNVKSYEEDKMTTTALVEGAVKIHSSNEYITLQAGDLIMTSTNHLSKKSNVDLAEHVAWKNKKFVFNETPIREAMAQITRWYNVKVRYEGNLGSAFFYGEISRQKLLSQALDILKESGVNFKILKEGQQVVLVVTE